MIEEHEFAQYIRCLGKGKRGQRSLTQQESFTATRLILEGKVGDVQLGAFLMLMRVKEETPEEIAGFVEAVTSFINITESMPAISIDWSSYAGKRRQLPWFVLSALLLSQNGYPVFMHGLSRNDERIYAEDALNILGIKACDSFDEVAKQINKTGFAYLPIDKISPLLNRAIELRRLLGLRTPGHTISRALNPLSAKLLMQGIFHPGYAEIHQKAALLLQQPLAAVFKGEGGEIERDPDRNAIVYGVNNGDLYTEEWPAIFERTFRHLKEETLDLNSFKLVWQGDLAHEYGEAAVISTAALALKALGVVNNQEDAFETVTYWWSQRSSLQVA